ncbi:unnamed protein product [Knipowitschia caucasica]
MKVVLLLASLLGASLGASLGPSPGANPWASPGGKHSPCKSPPLLTGGLTLATQNEKLWFYAGYEYDAFGERIRIREDGTFNKTSFTRDFLLLYKEAVLYEIDSVKYTCIKRPLKGHFQLLGIPDDANFVGQYVIGASSGPGQGVLVNTWGQHENRKKNDPYMMTVTEFGCFPVSTLTHTKDFGWMVTSFINTVEGILYPDGLNPPPYCPGLDAEPQGPPVDIITVISNLQKSANAV